MSSTLSDEPQKLRLYIGGISEDLHEEIDQLSSRLSKFGEVLSELEVHKKPTALTYFAYSDINISSKSLVKLKQHLNGVKFKNSKLIIDILSKTYRERWEEDKLKPDTKEADRLKREKIAAVRQDRILNGKDELVIKGRIRKTARKNPKNLTLRCYMNGKLISVKNTKTKVWGYDKTKKLRDLTWIFENRVWKDGNFHIVEKSTARQAKLPQDEEVLEEEEEFEVEKDTNKKILSNLFQNFDFDKPVDFEELENVEESGESDYEFELKFNRDSYDIKTKDCTDDVIEEYKKSNPIPEQTTIASEDDEDEIEIDVPAAETSVTSDVDDEFVPAFGKKDDVELSEPVGSDVDDEFMPVFGKKIDVEVNETEKLRDLFNPTTTTGFKLQDSDVEDVVEDDDIDRDEILKQQLSLRKAMLLASSRNKSLFFSHDKSPFLLSQSQLTKISKEFDKSEYETWFYEKRGELNREFKRYKRDFVRQFNKKKK